MDSQKSKDTNRLDISHYKSKLRTVKRVKWPGTSRDVGIMLLNCGELQRAVFAARETLEKGGIGIDLSTLEEFESERVNQLIYRFLVDPESKTGDRKYRIFQTCRDLKQSLSNSEREFFANEYSKLESEDVRSKD